MSFSELGLSEQLLQALSDCGYDTPTPIQEKAIPHVLMGRDLVALAQTGTGKTAGFTLPMIEILGGGRAKARMPRSLILSPTRELAAQIADNFEKYGKYHKLSMALLTGGTSMPEQIKKLERGVDVLIATPGRLLDLFERGNILLSGVKILVIDEADRMLDMGFIPDIEKIAGLLSPMRQTLLFSATMPEEISKLTKKFLSNPREVSVAPAASPAETVEQFLVDVSARDKNKILEKIIRQENVDNAFVFCNRKRDVDALAKWLKGKGYAAQALHGDMVQKARTQTLEDFKQGNVQLLICSDVAGRGIDIQGVSHVFNYDVPFNADDYVHRIGRTGRAGKTGRAWMLVKPDEDKVLKAIEDLTGRSITVEKVDGASARDDSGEQGQGDEGCKRSQRSSRGDSRDRDNEKKTRAAKSSQAKDSSSSKPVPKKKNSGASASKDGFGDDIPAFLR